MRRGTVRSWIACLMGVLLCFSALVVQFDDGQSAVRTVGQRGQIKGAVISILNVHRRWRTSAKASASRPSKPSPSSQVPPSPAAEPLDPSAKSLPVAPAPSLVATLSAPQPAIVGNSTGTNSSVNRSSPSYSLPLPASISPQLQPVSHAKAPSPTDTSLSMQPPLPDNNTSSLQPPSAPLLRSPPRGVAPSAASNFAAPPAPSLSSPPLEALPNGNVTPSDSPLTSPSSGCCAPNMVPRPGLPSDSCTCVYPIRLELLVADVSTNYANWSSEFQQELASQLGLEVIQIEITAFQFTGPNLSLVIVIGPLTSNSFSLQESETIKTDLDHFKVHFNTSLFGNYSLVRFRYFESPSPPPVQTEAPGLPPLPLLKNVPQDGSTGRRNGQLLSTWVIIAISVGAVIVISVLLVLLWRYLQPCRARKKSYRCSVRGVSSRASSSAFDASSYDTRSLPRSITTRLFTFDELKQATNNFELASVLGEGGFGRVYKGVLKDGTAVAIKRLTGGSQGDREFLVEVEMLSRLHHRNLVKLVGYYTSRDSSQHLLCYELIPNGSLEAWLHGPLGADQPLQWDIRMKIALDAARGLAYLHEDSQPSVIHRDFKASNILIENDFHAKVADFGLAKQAPEGQINYVATRVMGTFGYVAPEYAMTGHLLVKSDVYSYGVVLLELLSGRKPVDMSQPSGQENLVTWARPILRDKERLGELADPRLSCEYPREDFAQVAAIAAACVSPEASQRPTMGEVVQSLKMVQQSSEYPKSGERNASTEAVMVTTMSNRSFTTSFQNARQASATFESDGSSSVFSSGPFSGLIGLENDALSRTAVFSEDLHEGR